MTHLVAKQGCLCGELVLCDPEKKIPLVDHEKDGSTWAGNIEPKDRKGTKRKLQEQSLCFAVRGNHIAVIQTRDLNIKDLQDFLVWFIQTKAEVTVEWLFILQNLPSKSAIAKIKDQNITGIKIGKNAFTTVKTPVDATQEKTSRKRYTTEIQTDPFVMDLLKKLTKNDALIEDMEASTDPGSIHVEVEIKYKSRSEKESQRVMRSLAATFGDQPDLTPQIKLGKHGTIKGEELTIKDELKIQCPEGNMSADDAMTRLAEWLTEAIRTDKITL